MPESISNLLYKLKKDHSRKSNPFSADIDAAHRVMLDPWAIDLERAEMLNRWLQGDHQPCLFGRIAASKKQIHFCILNDEDLSKSNTQIKNKIAASRQLWKRRALLGMPYHGFMLAVSSRRVAEAAPDENLKRFSKAVQDLAGWVEKPDVDGTNIVLEHVYLIKPSNASIVKFTFSVDFFATAGDGRWWRDHRIPGGIAFTANSLGHMVRRKEWYEENSKNQIEWALRTAMLTIYHAAPTPHGSATWLISQSDKIGPIREYEWNETVPLPDLERLKGKDCGSYGGYLHTDHAIRDDFFVDAETPPRKAAPWLMDFAYIFDTASSDFATFMAGEEVTKKTVDAELGKRGDWRFITTDRKASASVRSRVATKRIEAALEAGSPWMLNAEMSAAFE